jgi:ribosomal protein L25 (general stress protein Ctc)
MMSRVPRTTRVTTLVALLSIAAGSAFAQKVALTEDDIRTAVAAGTKAKGRQHGLILRDSGQGWAAAMTAGGTSQASAGFWVEVFTPTTWIRQQASDAAREYRQMDPAAVADQAKAPVLRIIAHPDVPNVVTKSGLAGTSSVQHIVLRSEDKKIVVQPLSKETFTEEAKNAMGGQVAFEGINATFPMDALKELRGPKGNGEFFITIIGSSKEEKNFKIKQKHFDDLP